MIRPLALALALILPEPATAQALVATRNIRANQPIGPEDLRPSNSPARDGFVNELDEAIGMEARTMLYSGRAIPLASLSPPAVVERNQMVALHHVNGALSIRADGRALERGAVGDHIRVMNTHSRATITGIVAGPQLVMVP